MPNFNPFIFPGILGVVNKNYYIEDYFKEDGKRSKDAWDMINAIELDPTQYKVE